ncbi:MAG TPA: PIG-L deacetylase family protein, partial [Microthrixaceae bacterium]|nr:PIG-L deacetylase family protein [Microthrixaceae bacterium]
MAPRSRSRAPAVPDSALAIYAHPDDAELACAGTLAAWAAKGCRVSIVSVATGDKGGPRPDPGLAERRADESSAAAQILGADSWTTLGRRDGEFDNDVELRGRIVGIVRELRPAVVLTSDPTATFIGEHYVNHRDHRVVGWAVLDAVAPAASSGSYFPEAGPPHRVAEVLLSGTLQPDWWVDISTTIDQKVEALACHRSQLVDADALGDDALAGDAELVAEVVRYRAANDGREGG